MRQQLLQQPGRECPPSYFELPSEMTYQSWAQNNLPLLRDEYQKRQAEKLELCKPKTIMTNVENWVWPKQEEWNNITETISTLGSKVKTESETLTQNEEALNNTNIQIERIKAAIETLKKDKELDLRSLKLYNQRRQELEK